MAVLPKAEVWVDGSVHPKNPGNGGWGAVVSLPEEGLVVEAGGPLREKKTTNNQAEVQAVIAALQHVPKNNEVLVYSDSQYFILGFIKIKKGKLPKTNKIFWRVLVELITRKNLHCTGIKVVGHGNNENNNRAHKLAYNAAVSREAYVRKKTKPTTLPGSSEKDSG